MKKLINWYGGMEGITLGKLYKIDNTYKEIHGHTPTFISDDGRVRIATYGK